MTRARRTLHVPDAVAALLRHLHPELKRKVRAALETVVSEPGAGKSLKDELTGLRSFRVGKFRLIYRVRGTRIEVIAFGARERIYEETYRLISKSNPPQGAEEPRGQYRRRRLRLRA